MVKIIRNIIKPVEIIDGKVIRKAVVSFTVEYAEYSNRTVIVHQVLFEGNHAEDNKDNFVADYAKIKYNVDKLIIKHYGQRIK